jgi:hypothetical protein
VGRSAAPRLGDLIGRKRAYVHDHCGAVSAMSDPLADAAERANTVQTA